MKEKRKKKLKGSLDIKNRNDATKFKEKTETTNPSKG